MLTYCISSLLTAVTCLGLGVFVLYKNPKNPLHRSLFRLNLAVCFWSLFLFLHYLSGSANTALLTLKLLHIPAVLIPAFYLHFIIKLLGLQNGRAIKLSYLLSVIFLIINFSPYFILRIEPKLNFRFYATAGPLYIFWILTYLGLSGYGIYLLLKNYPLAPPAKKNQIKYVLLASIIGFAGGATIYPLFYDIPFAPVGEHIIFLYPLIFALAVLKHNLLDLNIVIRHTLIYSLSVILVTLLYLITVLLTERLLRNAVGYKSIWSTLIAAVGIALIFAPVKNRIQRIIDKFYIGSAYQRFKKELLESDKQKALAQLAAGMAHEIKNPLCAIKTFSEYLPRKFNDSDFREKFSRIVTQEVDKINSLVTQLLEFAKPSALNISPADIHRLLDDTLNLLSGEMIKNNIKLLRTYAPEETIVNIDANKIRQVFFNIIKNAIEAMSGGGTLTITTYRQERFIVEIGDTGCGIKARDISRIFEPFYSSKEKGTGLGLAVTQGIIAEHRGSISVKSNPGCGATFTISL